MRLPVPVVCALVVAACSSPTECFRQSRTINIPFDDPFPPALEERLAEWLFEEFVCVSEPLDDASGNRIGTRHVCSKCE